MQPKLTPPEVVTIMAKKECFVIMPFSDRGKPLAKRWDNLFKNCIKPAVVDAKLGYACVRSLNPHGNFARDIMNHLATAEVVIAVLTELRPNVMYELGVRNALRKRTIMIAERDSPIPSNLSAFIALHYSIRTKQGREALTRVIQEKLTALDAQEPESDNPVADFLSKRAQDIVDDWHAHKDPRALTAKITDVLPSYAFQLGVLLNQVGQHLTYSSIEKSVRASLASSDVIAEVRAAGKEGATRPKEISKMLAGVADKAIEAIREESFLTLDTRPLLTELGAEGNVLQLLYDQFLSVSSFLDYVWSTMRRHVDSVNYGVTWVLRDAESDKIFKDAGRTWAKKNLGNDLDERTLASIGIKAGMKLEAVPFSEAD